MEFFDRPLPPPMRAANIRALYEQNPTNEAPDNGLGDLAPPARYRGLG